jgi:hypothetical protein
MRGQRFARGTRAIVACPPLRLTSSQNGTVRGYQRGAPYALSAVNFTDFADSVRDYVYEVKLVVAGASSALPDAPTMIA